MATQIFLIFIPTWGKFSNLTNIFQMGWNHQLVMNSDVYISYEKKLFVFHCHVRGSRMGWSGLLQDHPLWGSLALILTHRKVFLVEKGYQNRPCFLLTFFFAVFMQNVSICSWILLGGGNSMIWNIFTRKLGEENHSIWRSHMFQIK